MIRALRFGVLFLTLAGLAGAVVLERPALSAGAAQADARRVLTYDLSAAAPTFPLSGGDRLLRLVTNAILPADAADADVPYTVEVAIARPGEPVETRTLALVSHRTGARNAGVDACFDRAQTPIADSRRVDIPLDPPAPPGTRVTVRTAAAVPALVRAWTLQPRANPERTDRLLALYPELRRDIGDPLGLVNWDHLTDAERNALHDEGYARLAASGRPGVDHVFHDMYVRDVPPVRTALSGPAVDLSRPTTWVVTGPAPVRLRVSAPQGSPATHVTAWREDGTITPLGDWDIGGDAPDVDATFEFPAGQQVFAVRAADATPLQVEVDAPEELPAATLHLHAAAIGADTVAILDAEQPAGAGARTVEIEAWATTDADPKLTLQTISASGTRTDTVPLTLPANDYDSWRDEAGAIHALRGPIRVRLLVPADAREVHVGSDVAALVRFRVPFHDAPEDDPQPPTLRAVGLSTDPAQRSWVRPIRPTEEVEILVQPRLEPLPLPTPTPPTWLAASLDVLGLAERLSVLEPIRGPAIGRFLTEVAAGTPLRVHTSAAGTTHARWSYEVDDTAALGASVPLTVDGSDTATLRLATRRGTLRLPALSPGDHVLEARPPKGARMFVNLPAAAGQNAPAYRSRTVWRIGTAPVRITVNLRGAGPRGLNIVAYDPATGERPAVRWTATLDGGAPRRRTQGVYTRSTPARRTWTLPAAAHPEPAVRVDGERAAIGRPRTVSFPLGDDLTPGAHVIEIRADQPMNLRFFVVEPPGSHVDEAVFTLESSDSGAEE